MGVQMREPHLLVISVRNESEKVRIYWVVHQEVGKMFPTIKTFFNKTLREDQKQGQAIFYKY